MDRLKGRVAAITGGASGIGRAMCIRFAQEGADIAIADVNRGGAEETAEEVRKLGSRAIAVAANVTKKSDCERFVDETEKELGGLDIFVANAGKFLMTPFLQMEQEDWDSIVATNITGTFLSCQAAARRMVERGRGGRIILMSSVASEMASLDAVAYSATKAAVRIMTKCMALELAPHDIVVNAIGPGLIDTPLIAAEITNTTRALKLDLPVLANRFGTPDDVASVALFLASDECSYMSGGIICPDGGYLVGLRPDAVTLDDLSLKIRELLAGGGQPPA